MANHGALRVQPDRDAILRRDPGAAHAVEGRAWISDFDETRNSDASVNVLVSQLRLFRAQSFVIHHSHELVQRGMMRQQLKSKSRRRRARVSVVSNEISATDLHRIHSDSGCRQVDQAFRHRACYGVTDGAVLAHYVLVLEHDARPGAIVLG